MIDTRLIGPKDDQYAVLSLGTVWLATTKAPYAEAVSAAIAAVIAGGGATDAAPSATEETAIGHARYEYLRTLNPRKFAALYNEALMGVHQFDDLVDRYRMEARPVDHGYDRSASLSAGHYVCTCGGGRNRHYTTQEQPK